MNKCHIIQNFYNRFFQVFMRARRVRYLGKSETWRSASRLLGRSTKLQNGGAVFGWPQAVQNCRSGEVVLLNGRGRLLE